MFVSLSASALGGPSLDPGLRKALAACLRPLDGAGTPGHSRSGRAGSGVGERLLASAAGHLRSRDPDPHAALILAAAACEAKVKDVLRASAPARLQPLLEFTLGNPRDVALSAISRFDGLCKVVTGRSLKEESRKANAKKDSHPGLYRRLELLFQARNGVAHKGEEVTIADAENHLSTALDVFAWLDLLPPRRPPAHTAPQTAAERIPDGSGQATRYRAQRTTVGHDLPSARP